MSGWEVQRFGGGRNTAEIPRGRWLRPELPRDFLRSSIVALGSLRAFGPYALGMAYPARLLSPDEEIITQFRPHWHALLIPIVTGLVAIAAIVVAVLFTETMVTWILVVGIVAVWVLASARAMANWWTTQYVLTTERVVHRAGVLSRRGTEIPLEVINNVAFSQGVFERLIRSGDLLIESAGESGQSRFVNIPDPEGLQSQIYQVREKRMLVLNTGTPATPSRAGELERLADLRDRGVLSPEEFDEQKRRLLE